MKPKYSPGGPISDKKLRKQRNRFKAVQELVKSEESYVQMLKLLILFYSDPMSEYLSSDKHKTLFGDIHTIYNFNKNLCKTLEACFDVWNENTSTIADKFIKFIPYLKMYQNYLNQYDNATKLLKTLQKDSRVCIHIDIIMFLYKYIFIEI